MDHRIIIENELFPVESDRIGIFGKRLNVVFDMIGIIIPCRIIGQPERRAFRLHQVDVTNIVIIVED